MTEIRFGTQQLALEVPPGDTLAVKEPADDFPEWSPDNFLQCLHREGFAEFLNWGKPLEEA